MSELYMLYTTIYLAVMPCLFSFYWCVCSAALTIFCIYLMVYSLVKCVFLIYHRYEHTKSRFKVNWETEITSGIRWDLVCIILELVFFFSYTVVCLWYFSSSCNNIFSLLSTNQFEYSFWIFWLSCRKWFI